MGNSGQLETKVNDEKTRQIKECSSLISAISKEIAFRMKTGKDPIAFLAADLDFVEYQIKRGDFSLDDLELSEGQWKDLRHREKVANALVRLNNCKEGMSSKALDLMELIKPKGEVDPREISATEQEIEACKIMGVEYYFNQWFRFHCTLFLEIDKLLDFLARSEKEFAKNVISKIHVPPEKEELKEVFMRLFSERSQRNKNLS